MMADFEMLPLIQDIWQKRVIGVGIYQVSSRVDFGEFRIEIFVNFGISKPNVGTQTMDVLGRAHVPPLFFDIVGAQLSKIVGTSDYVEVHFSNGCVITCDSQMPGEQLVVTFERSGGVEVLL